MTTEIVPQMPLAQFVEVYEAHSAKYANLALKAGYTLLHIENSTRAQLMPNPDGSDRQQYFVRRGVVFVLGRTEDVPAWEPPTKAGAR